MRKFAEGTTVGAGATKGQIEDILMAHGCARYGSMADSNSATIMFEHEAISYRMTIALPDPEDPAFCEYKQGGTTFRRSDAQCQERYLAEFNRRWRAMFAVIKAKLIAVNEGITSFESEFLAHACLQGGKTFGEHYIPEMKQAALDGHMPQIMALPGRKR